MLWPGWVGDAADQALAGRWFHGHSLLEQAIERQATEAGTAPVEAKGDFVQVVGQPAPGSLRPGGFPFTPPLTGQRIGTAELMEAKAGRWQQRRNAAGRGIEWKFTRRIGLRQHHAARS